MVIEVTKIFTIYIHQVTDIIENSSSKEELVQLIREEAVLVAISIPILFSVLYGFYAGYNANIDVIIKITKELESSRISLEQKELLILSLSHEARNPLNSIIGNIELAYDEIRDENTRKKLRKAKMSSDVLLYLINNFIDTGKINTDSLEVCITEVNFVPFIQSIWQTFAELIKSKGLEPKLEISKDIPKILKLDQHRIAQILFNLISNAVKFTETGGITLRIFYTTETFEDASESISMIPDEGTQNSIYCVYDKNRASFSPTYLGYRRTMPEIDLDFTLLEDTRGTLIFDVIDTGIGMSKEDQSTLFERCEKPGQNMHKTKLGVGLGLWIINEACRKLKAKIEVNSELGKGTRFSLSVRTEKVRASLNKSAPLDPIPVMIVDDEPFNIEIIANYIKSFGLDVSCTAKHGARAAELFEESIKFGAPIKLITMDLEMPEVNGKEACKRIRRLEKQYGIQDTTKIIIISGNSVESEVSACLDPNGEIRADYFFRKPVKKDELKTTLTLLFGNSFLSSSKEILFVDKHRDNPKALENLLEANGFKSTIVEEEHIAIEEFSKRWGVIKAVVINCEMNGIDGMKLGQKIINKANEIGAKVPILVGLIDILRQSFLDKAKTINMRIENKFIFINQLPEFLRSI